MRVASPMTGPAAQPKFRRGKLVVPIEWLLRRNHGKRTRELKERCDWPLMADCRPPSKASNFSTNGHGRAWYAALKPTLVNATTEVRRSGIAVGLVMA